MARRLAGRYVLGDQIGAGGTSRVHEAHDERLGRRVAVKLLDASLVASADPAGRERFVTEGRTTAGFHHRHAVTVFDAGEDDGDLFMVMELVEGESLAELLARRGPLPIPEVMAIAAPLTSVLAAAHAAGIVHRDVKPANVLLAGGDEGEGGGHGGGHDVVKLADFGIAKRFDDLEGSLTATGTVMGTPRYLAPEQAVGSPVGPATDVYALGIVIFEMLTGRPPFEADSMVAAAMVQQSQPAPDVRSLRPEVPAALAALVARALERSPVDRFATAGEMAAALDEAWAPGAASPEASVPTQVLAVVDTPVATSGPPASDTRVLPAALPPPHVPADVEQPSGAGSPRRLGAVLVFGLVLALGAAVVIWATGRDDRSELVAPDTVAPDASADPSVSEPPATQPAATEPPVTDPPVTEPPTGEIIPGFAATNDLAVFLEQLERDPDLVGEGGEDLAEDLRSVLEAPGGSQRSEARKLREDLAELVDEDEIDPAIAAALDALLAPLADG